MERLENGAAELRFDLQRSRERVHRCKHSADALRDVFRLGSMPYRYDCLESFRVAIGHLETAIALDDELFNVGPCRLNRRGGQAAHIHNVWLGRVHTSRRWVRTDPAMFERGFLFLRVQLVPCALDRQLGLFQFSLERFPKQLRRHAILCKQVFFRRDEHKLRVRLPRQDELNPAHDGAVHELVHELRLLRSHIGHDGRLQERCDERVEVHAHEEERSGREEERMGYLVRVLASKVPARDLMDRSGRRTVRGGSGRRKAKREVVDADRAIVHVDELGLLGGDRLDQTRLACATGPHETELAPQHDVPRARELVNERECADDASSDDFNWDVGEANVIGALTGPQERTQAKRGRFFPREAPRDHLVTRGIPRGAGRHECLERLQCLVAEARVLLLIDFIRQVINHKHTGVTMPHADLKSQPFWIGLSDPKQMEGMKLLLQQFHLVYSADEGRIMEWDSDLIVPAFWQTKTPAERLFLGDILRLDTNTTTRDASCVDWEYHFNSTNQSRDVDAVRVHWEYHFEFKLPSSSLFDHLVVASVSPHVKFDAGPDWILYREEAVAACRIMVGRDAASLHRTIHVEAVVAKAATQKDADKLWAVFTQLCGAFVHVLRAYPALVVSSFAWDDADNKIGLKRLMKSKAADESAAWMPPAVTWKWVRRLQSDAVAQETFQ